MKAHFYCISSARQIFKIQKLRIGEDKNERRVQVIPQQYSAILPFGKKPFGKKDIRQRYHMAKQFGKKYSEIGKSETDYSAIKYFAT